MGIDRIGKGGAPPATPETQGSGSVEKKGGVEKTFSVERTEAPKQPAEVAATGAAARPHEMGVETDRMSALARLRAGEIDVNGYVDLRGDEATKGLEGLSAAELDDIKKVLRDQMATDPALTDLVGMATGKTPDVPED